MSEFDDIFGGAAGVAISIKGTAVTYTEPGAAGVSLTAIVGPVEGQAEEEGERANIVADRTREVTISTNASGEFGGVAAPRLDAKFTIGSEDWAIQSVIRQSASLTTLRCIRPQTREVARRGYRG